MFKVGLYEREITPLFGNNLSGYFNARPVSGVKDKTYAKAAVIESNGKKMAMLAIDACDIGEKLISAIRARVCENSDIDGDFLTVSATHSHTASPGEIDTPKSTEKADGFYLEWLAMAAADTLLCANQRLREAKIKFTKTEISGTTFVRNYLMKDGSCRTNPGVLNPDIERSLGTPDHTASVFFFESLDGEPLGMSYSFANHQDSVDGTEVSADWSGVVSRKMKEKFGMDFISIFFIGTAGDVNQTDVNNSEVGYAPEHLYKKLGSAVFDGIERALPSLVEICGDISAANLTKTYRTRFMTKEEAAREQAVLDSVSLPEDIKLDAGSPPELFKACMARRALMHNKNATPTRTVRFQVLKLADILIFALPGEVYTEFGKKIRAAFPENECFFACLSNNGWSYMPTPDRYLPGLYESLFGSAKFYPEDTENIFDTFIELGKKLI